MVDGKEIKQEVIQETDEQDFKLGSWVCSRERHISVRRALAWHALNKLINI